jgi:DNA polymerase-3 subunit chi
MTRVEFRTSVPDPAQAACALARDAVSDGRRVQVIAPAVLLAALDRMLWTFDDRSFVAHVLMSSANSTLAARTPLWLAEAILDQPGLSLLINVGADLEWRLLMPEQVPQQVVELVSSDPEDAARGRIRWREWKLRGAELTHRAGGQTHG